MKKHRLPFITMLFCLISTVAYANSSWHWISEKRPYDVLPFVIVLTLIIEILSVIFIAGVKQNKLKAVIVVIVGNLLSFAAPYISAATDRFMYTFRQILEHLPFYTVSFWYMVTTLIIEIPVVYNCLKNNAKSKKALLVTIIVSNIFTTLMTGVAERLLCRGEW